MATGRFDTVGIDLVAMCVDDLVCCGARPLFFLDYQLLGQVDPHQVRQVMTGIAAGCRPAGLRHRRRRAGRASRAARSPASSMWPASRSASWSGTPSSTDRLAPGRATS